MTETERETETEKDQRPKTEHREPDLIGDGQIGLLLLELVNLGLVLQHVAHHVLHPATNNTHL